MSILDEAVILNSGSLMPKLGLNVNSEQSLTQALKLGYRLFSVNSDQLALVKKSIDQSGVLLPQVFLQLVLTKDQDSQKINQLVLSKLHDLGISYFDMVVLEEKDDLDSDQASYAALEKLKIQGRIKSIGLREFYLDNLRALLAKSKVEPLVDVLNVADPQLSGFLRANRIKLEQDLVLNGNGLDDLAQKKKVSPEQLLLKYNLEENKIMMLDDSNDLRADSQLDFALSVDERQLIANNLNN